MELERLLAYCRENQGRVQVMLVYSLDRFARNNRAEKTVAGMKEALARGRWTFRAPLGHRNVRRPDGTPSLEPDPERGPLVRKGFELYATGLHSKKAVLRRLNQEGLRTPRGKRVSPQTSDRMLEHPL